MPIRRGFADIAEGQIHYRCAGTDQTGTPLVMFHPEPGSSLVLGPLIEALAVHRPVYAFDTPGAGDSCSPPKTLTVPALADMLGRAIHALGLGQIHAAGPLSGALLSLELAIARPEQVKSAVLDGVVIIPKEVITAMQRDYIPDVQPDLNGSQIHTFWTFARDQYLFYPWYNRTAEGRRDIGLPEAERLHQKYVEILKGIKSLRMLFHTMIGHPVAERLPLATQPLLLPEDAAGLAQHPALMQSPRIEPLTAPPEAVAAKATEIQAFLASHD